MKKFIFVCYGNETKGYRLFDTVQQKIIFSRDVVFNELMQPVESVLATCFAESAYALCHKLCFAPPLVGTHSSIVSWCKISWFSQPTKLKPWIFLVMFMCTHMWVERCREFTLPALACHRVSSIPQVTAV